MVKAIPGELIIDQKNSFRYFRGDTCVFQLLTKAYLVFPQSGLPEVPEPLVLHPNVLQHTIYHPSVFDKGAEPTFMAPVKVYTLHFLSIQRAVRFLLTQCQWDACKNNLTPRPN